MLEIYQDSLVDLLVNGGGKNGAKPRKLEIKKDSKVVICLAGHRLDRENNLNSSSVRILFFGDNETSF